jgi:hypothetical protein
MTQSATGLANGTPYLALFNGAANAGTFQINEVNVGGSFPSGSYTIGAPLAAAVPELSTWAMLILGFAGIGFVACRPLRIHAAVGLSCHRNRCSCGQQIAKFHALDP